jgi:hypothetical protein
LKVRADDEQAAHERDLEALRANVGELVLELDTRRPNSSRRKSTHVRNQRHNLRSDPECQAGGYEVDLGRGHVEAGQDEKHEGE